jgi:NTE family protein
MPYWDGGLFDNTPLSKAIDALEKSEDPDMTMYVVNLFPSAAPIPRNLPEVFTRMVTLAFSNRTEKDVRRAKRTTQIIKFVEEIDRLMPTHPELRRLKDHPGYRAVKERKRPINIVEITNIDVTGPADFSPEAIENRRLRGYAAADAAVREHGLRDDGLPGGARTTTLEARHGEAHHRPGETDRSHPAGGKRPRGEPPVLRGGAGRNGHPHRR